MLHTPHEFQQYFALAADRHRCLLADAAAHRLVTGMAGVGPVRRLRWALGDLLLIAGARLTAGRPRAATAHSSST
jgi:hypothetical protein